MNFERPNEREKEPPSVDKILERAIMLRSMKNWLGQFMLRHAAEDAEQPLGSREDLTAAITHDEELAGERGDIEEAAKLNEMRERFEDESIIPPEARTMEEITDALGDEYRRMATLAREKSPKE